MTTYVVTIAVAATAAAPGTRFTTSVRGEDKNEAIVALYSQAPKDWWPARTPFQEDWKIVDIREHEPGKPAGDGWY